MKLHYANYRQPFDDRNSPRDHVVTALVTLGEGYHNFHHEVMLSRPETSDHCTDHHSFHRITATQSNGGNTIPQNGLSGHGSKSDWPQT